MGVHLYASAGISVPGPGGRGHSHTVEVFCGVKQDSPEMREAFANLVTSMVCSSTPHPACHGVFVAGDWEVIEGRKFTGWILTERHDFLILIWNSRTGGTSPSWTRYRYFLKRRSSVTATGQTNCSACGRNGK